MLETLPAPLTIGLLGQFGVGKSTVIEFLKQSYSDSTHDRVIRLSAERHTSAGLERSLIYSISEKLVECGEVSEEKITEKLVALEATGARATTDALNVPLRRLIANNKDAAKRGLKLAATIAVAWLTLVVAVGALRSYVTGDASLLWAAISSAVGAPLSVIFGALVGLWGWLSTARLAPIIATNLLKPDTVTTTRPRLETADEFERFFADLVGVVSKRLVICVDDIDRLPRDRVLAALNAIHDFQAACSRLPNTPVFVVSCDESILREALAVADLAGGATSSSFETVSETHTLRLADAYLDRFFSQRVYVPAQSAVDLRGYARSILSKGHAGAAKLAEDLQPVVEVLIYDGVKDPRHVVRLLNAFFGDYRLAYRRENQPGRKGIKPGDVTGRPRVLARVSVLRSDFKRAFELIREDPQLLPALEALVRGDDLTLQERDRVLEFFRRHDGIVPPEEHSDRDRSALEDEFISAQSLDLPIYSFIGRTTGWVEEVASLKPFIELAQDEIDRSLGSDRSSELRQLIVNGRLRDLRVAVDELRSTGGDPQTYSDFVSMLSVLLRETSGVELDNTVKSVDDILPRLDQANLPPIADALGIALRRSPAARKSVMADTAILIPLASEARVREELFEIFVDRDPDFNSDIERRAIVLFDLKARLNQVGLATSDIDSLVLQFFSLIAAEGDREELGPWLERFAGSTASDEARLKDSFVSAALRLTTSASSDNELPDNSDVDRLLALSLGTLSQETARALEEAAQQSDLTGPTGRFIVQAAATWDGAPLAATEEILRIAARDTDESWLAGLQAGTLRGLGACCAIQLGADKPSNKALRHAEIVAARLIDCGSPSAEELSVTDIDAEELQEIGMTVGAQVLAEYPSQVEQLADALIDRWREERFGNSDAVRYMWGLAGNLDLVSEDVAARVVSAVRETLDNEKYSDATRQALSLLSTLSQSTIGRGAAEDSASHAVQVMSSGASLDRMEVASATLSHLSELSPTALVNEDQAFTILRNLLSGGDSVRSLALRTIRNVKWTVETESKISEYLAPHEGVLDAETLLFALRATSSARGEGFSPTLSDGLSLKIARVVPYPSVSTEELATLWNLGGRATRAKMAANSDRLYELETEFLMDQSMDQRAAEADAWLDEILVTAEEVVSGAARKTASVISSTNGTESVALARVQEHLDGLRRRTRSELEVCKLSLPESSRLTIVPDIAGQLAAGGERAERAAEVLGALLIDEESDSALTRAVLASHIIEQLEEVVFEQHNQSLAATISEALSVQSSLAQRARELLGRTPRKGKPEREAWLAASAVLMARSAQK